MRSFSPIPRFEDSHMRLCRLYFGSALALVFASALAVPPRQDGEAAKVIALGKSENLVMEHLDHLVNRIGPRLTSSHGFRDACDWTCQQFEKFGLQHCRLEPWGEFPVGFNRGPSSGRMIAPEKKELHFGTNAWTAGTSGPVSGPALLAPTNEEELSKVRSKLKGAWVIAPAPARGGGRRPAPGDAPGNVARGTDVGTSAARGSSANAVEAGTRGDAASASTTATRGDAASTTTTAAATAGDGAAARDRAADRKFRDELEKVYDAEGIAGTIRSGNGELILTSGNSKISFDKLPTRPAITLLAAEHKEISDKLKAGEEVRLEFDIRNWFENGPIQLCNVIAEIPGTEKPDEVVIVGGHLDSWDGATGTTDNGTGVATTLEAARLLAKANVHPKRTIRFMLWGGEEEGLLGSAAYVKKHKDEMPRISAVLVHDGGTNYCAGITATPPMVKPLEEIFAPVKDLDPELPFKVREVKGLSGGGSDHSSFLSANVPGFFWSQRGRANYNHTHHTQFDTFDAAIPEYQRNSAIVIAVGALGIANLPELLSRENLRAPNNFGGGRRLGVQLSDNLTIEEVVEDGLAAKIGLLVGDRLLKIGDHAIADSDEMRTEMQAAPAKTKIVVLRGGKEIDVPIEFPPDAGPGGAFGRRLGMRFGEGLTIDVVTPGAAADTAGLAAGDRIVKIADKPVSEPRELFQELGDLSGDVKVVVVRDGKEVTVTLKLPERP
jgi:hypothetical protein